MSNIRDFVMVHSERHDTRYVLAICAVAALGGILFGYDTSVISGAVHPLQEHFALSAAATGWAVSNVVVGCVAGALLAGWMADGLGRRMTLVICAVIFSVQSLGTARVASARRCSCGVMCRRQRALPWKKSRK